MTIVHLNLNQGGIIMAVLVISKDNFEQEVLKSDKVVLIDFWASWCGPCKMFAPIIDKVAEERPDVKVCKVNVDEEPELSKKFGIVSIPTLVVIKNGEVVAQESGVMPKQHILNMI